MVCCQGIPTGPCPISGPKQVKLCNGDLMLCESCNQVRFPSAKKSSVKDNSTNIATSDAITSGDSTVNNASPPVSKDRYLMQPVLAYVSFALQSGPAENVKNAVLGFFSAEDIIEAKNKLWEFCGETALGEKLKRKDSSTRSEREAHLFDIITALSKLDREDNAPTIVIDAMNLNKIPRSHPEELNNISLVDRLNRLESKLSSVVETMDRYIGENILLRDEIEDLKMKGVKTYADITSSHKTPSMPSTIPTCAFMTENKACEVQGQIVSPSETDRSTQHQSVY